jgi:hypothetical protein
VRAFCDHWRASRGERSGEKRRSWPRPPSEVPQRVLDRLGRTPARSTSRSVKKQAPCPSRSRMRACSRPRARARPLRRRPEQRGVLAEVQATRPDRRPARPRRPRPPRPRRTAGPSTTASTRRSGAAARRAPTPRRAARAPGAGRAPRAAGRPRAAGGWRSTPCQLGAKRARRRCSAGSISLRSAASERAPQPAQHLGVAPLALACRRGAARRARARRRARGREDRGESIP